jgi:hypothetical protein
MCILRYFALDQRGGLAVVFGLALPLLTGAVVVTVDTANMTHARGVMQAAADAGALGAVRELSMPGAIEGRVGSIAARLAAGQLGPGASDVQITPIVSAKDGTVTLVIEKNTDSIVGNALGLGSSRLGVRATARIAGKAKICLIALNTDKGKTISIAKRAKLTAKECSVFANSKDSQALSVKDDAMLRASRICSSGGIEGMSRNFSPQPLLDCPPLRDPLALRPAPSVGPCDYTDKVVEKGVTTLGPGVYCGGLKVTGNAVARLQEGIYVIRNGKLIVDANATIEGVGVGFYLTGGNAQFEFDKGTTISLQAPKSGPMAGLLFFEDRSAAHGSKHTILSNNAHTLLGTIYLPQGTLHIDAEAPISNRAAYTIIVTNQIELVSGPELFLNANYDASTVPVPEGVGPIAGLPRLEK